MKILEKIDNYLNEKSKEGKDYKEFFEKMLHKHGWKSPEDIPSAKRKFFYDKIDREWKAKKETD